MIKSSKDIADLLLHNENITIVAIQNSSAPNITVCGSIMIIVSVNLVSGLIYFDLVKNEHSASINNKMIFFIKDTSISSLWLIVLIVLSHEEKGSGDGAGLFIIRSVKI